MWKLLKVAVFVAAAAILVYFAVYVPLGKKTLAMHLAGIFQTNEARELGVELRKKVEDTTRDLGRSVTGLEKADPDKEQAKDNERLTDRDRQALDTLIEKKREPNDAERLALEHLIQRQGARRD